MMPADLDLYIIEMDINNESGYDTIVDDDTLFRELLGLPRTRCDPSCRCGDFVSQHDAGISVWRAQFSMV